MAIFAAKPTARLMAPARISAIWWSLSSSNPRNSISLIITSAPPWEAYTSPFLLRGRTGVLKKIKILEQLKYDDVSVLVETMKYLNGSIFCRGDSWIARFIRLWDSPKLSGNDVHFPACYSIDILFSILQQYCQIPHYHLVNNVLLLISFHSW